MIRNFEAKSDFERNVLNYIDEFGGIKNFHIHGDRAYTREDRFYKKSGKSIKDLENLSLSEKQKLTWILHNGEAFTRDSLIERGERLIKESIGFGVTELNTTIDITYNTKLKSLEVWENLKKYFSEDININLWAYNPSGFKVRGLSDERYELFEEAGKRCDGLVALAEKDDKKGHIGISGHNIYMACLSHELNKPVQYHVGQENSLNDISVEILLNDLEYVQDKHFEKSPNVFPRQIMVHAISPSCKSSEDFDNIASEMAHRKVSLIVCPRAALSMLQKSDSVSHTSNSIAKAWNFAVKGIDIGLGIDNLHDIYVPASSADVYEELEYLANSLRMYDERILTKILCGDKLDDFDKGTLSRSLGI